MQRFVSIVTSALFCVFVFLVISSCNRRNTKSELNIKGVGIIMNQSTSSYEAGEEIKVDTFFYCTGTIEWYNVTTNELKITLIDNEDVPLVGWKNIGYSIFLDDEKLFDLGMASCFMSHSLNVPVLIYGCSLINDDPDTYTPERFGKYHIGRGYPNWEYWKKNFWTGKVWTATGWEKPTEDCEDNWVKEREKNWKAIEPGWNKFIAQLKKEKKYRK